jgi:hypothetical protein
VYGYGYGHECGDGYAYGYAYDLIITTSSVALAKATDSITSIVPAMAITIGSATASARVAKSDNVAGGPIAIASDPEFCYS